MAPLRHRVEAMTLEQVSGRDAASQAERIRSSLPAEPFVIVAESYSGRVLYELLKSGEIANLVHVIFVASFLRRPTWLSAFASLLPTTLVQRKVLLERVGSRLMFGRFWSPDLAGLFSRALMNVDPGVVKSRIKEINRMKRPNVPISMQATYVQASHDILVGESVLTDFERLFEKCNFVRLSGTHFLMQTNPAGVWEVIDDVAV